MTPTAPPKAPPPRNAAPQQSKVAAPTIGMIEPTFDPPRIVLNAVEGWGKTTFGAYAPDPVIVMTQGETGYKTLLGAKRVPRHPGVEVNAWDQLLAVVDSLIEDSQGRKSIVIDAQGGAERLCHEHVCKRDFRGDWGERGFGSFQKGYDVSVTDWLQLLARLDRLREAHGMAVVMLSHCQVKPFKNPLGADFDRYIADVHAKTWAATAKWADTVLFGNFLTVVDNEKQGKGKGIGGTDRVIYTERRDAFDAKNRYGMPDIIDVPNDPSQTWATVWQFIQQ